MLTTELTPQESRLYRYLTEHRERPCTRTELTQAIWGNTPPAGTCDALEQLVRRLRGKIEPHPEYPQLLITVRKTGYLLRKEERTTMKTNRASLEQDMATLFAAKTSFLVIDTETTGLLSDPGGQIIEISAINQDGEVVFTSLVKPDATISAKAAEAHGLHADDLVDAPTFTQIWPRLLAVLCLYEHVYCYNVEFDQGMLLKTAKRFGLETPAKQLVEAQQWHCMMEAYAAYHGDWSEWHGSYTRKKLSVACASLRVPMSEAHRATGDCLNTLGLMRALAAKGADVASKA